MMKKMTAEALEATAGGMHELDYAPAHYINLVAQAFLAHLVAEAKKGVPIQLDHYDGLLHDYGRILDYLTENLQPCDTY